MEIKDCTNNIYYIQLLKKVNYKIVILQKFYYSVDVCLIFGFIKEKAAATCQKGMSSNPLLLKIRWIYVCKMV